MPDHSARGATSDTIFAPATGAGRAAVAIVRISGTRSHDAIRSLTRQELPPWRTLSLATLRAADGDLLDRAMVVVFPEGASYTGEAMAEVQCHGGTAVLSDVLDSLMRLPGLRLAEPGEFTRRALFAGRMDLSEVEGLSDLIAAETSEQRRYALRLHSGAVSRQVAGWRERLLRARALLEVTIDWADDEVPEHAPPEVTELIDLVIAGMEDELMRAGPAERLRSGFEIAIIGPPNAGKSSLLNVLAGREAAIVSEIAGTTRDVVEVRYDLVGLPVTFLDTAGLREASDPVESIGVERARRRAEAADLRLHLQAPDVSTGSWSELEREGDIRVWAKSDLGSGPGDVAISVPRVDGFDELLELLRQRLAERAGEAGLLGNLRQRQAVETASQHMHRSRYAIRTNVPEVAAEELRLATTALDRVVGRIGVEDVLSEIFAGFCLGK